MRTSQKSETAFFLPLNKILDMGARVEAALFNNNISKEDKKILEYLKEYLLFRKKILSGEINPSTESLNEKMNGLRVSKEDLHALNMWARGSRKRKDDVFNKDELDFLYERIEEKLSSI